MAEAAPQKVSSVGSSPARLTNVQHVFICHEQALPRGDYRRQNPDYETWGTKYVHIEKWRTHHGIVPDPGIYVIHHKDEDKKNNEVCEGPRPCPVLDCGNLALLTRADHIREHRPGKMSGQKGFVDTKQRKQRAGKKKP